MVDIATPIPFLDLRRQYEEIGEELEERVLQILRSGKYVGGPEVESLESEFADYCGAGYAVAVNSGTAALHVALLALGVGSGDEVITVSHTFVATAEAIVAVGAKPVFVDIEPKSYNLDVTSLEAALSPRTRAILPVHLYGHPANMKAILEIAGSRGIPVIEDACQAHGASYEGSRVGSLGAIGCFSFYPSKNLGGAGEGGIAITSSAELARRMAQLRDHGQGLRYQHELVGFNYRLPAIQAAILRIKLRHLDSWNQRRLVIAARYMTLLANADVVLPEWNPATSSVYHLFVIRSRMRDELMHYLSDKDITTGIHYPVPIHLQPPYRVFGTEEGSLPNTEMTAQQVLSLPIFPEMKLDEVERVAHEVQAFGVGTSRVGALHES